MSGTVVGWLFGGWSFGQSSDNTGVGHRRPQQSEKPHPSERAADTGTNDQHLVAQLRAGDATTLEVLFLRYYGPLVRFAASYVGSMDDGEEVVADVFARLWEQRATWTATTGVSAYLFNGVRHRALDMVRHRARDSRRTTMFRDAGETLGVAVPSRDVAEQVERDDTATLVLRLLARLPERRRLILSLRWKHRLTWDEIAAVLGVTSAAVQREHSRILASLRAELEAY